MLSASSAVGILTVNGNVVNMKIRMSCITSYLNMMI